MTEKAEIVVVGWVHEDGSTSGWVFDGKGHVPAITVDDEGRMLWGGWTAEELRAIAEGAEAAP